MAKQIKGISSSAMDNDPAIEDSLPPIDDGDKTPVQDEATLELDKYGIWVKAEPEDFEDKASFDDKDMVLEDLNLEEEQDISAGDEETGAVAHTDMMDNLDIPEEESLQTVEEMGGENGVSLEEEKASENEIISFDDSEPVQETVVREDEELTMESMETPSLEEEPPSLEEETSALDADFSLDLEEEAPSSDEESTLEEVEISGEAEAGEPAAEDFSLDDMEISEDAAEESAEELSLEDVALPGESAESPMAEAELPGEDSTEESGSGDFEEVSLDDLGIEISEQVPDEDGTVQPVEQQPAPAAYDEDDEAKPHIIDDEFSALPLELDEVGEENEKIEGRQELEIEDLELPEEESVSEIDQSESLTLPEEEESLGEVMMEESAGDQEVLEEIPELEIGAEESVGLELGREDATDEIEVPLSEDVSIPEADEDLETIGADLGSAEQAPSGSDAAILAKIEAELRSIKNELTELKSELGILRGRKGASRGESKGRQAADEGGDSFEEEEDETIALTGEELDNILTTADIKEEEKTETIDEQAEESDLDLGEDILSYDDTPSLEEIEPESSSEQELEEIGEEITVDVTSSEKDHEDDTGDIDIEIPELESEGSEIPELDMSDEAEPLEDLSLDESVSESSEELEPIAPLEVTEEPGIDLAETPADKAAPSSDMQLPSGLREEIKSVLGYMDQLLESLPEEKIEEFAKSEYFTIYKKLFEELGLVT